MVDLLDKISKFKSDDLKEAQFIQEKLQMFTLPFCRAAQAGSYFSAYLSSMKSKINNKTAYNTFLENINYPLPTVTFCESVSNSIYKIFQGDNKFIKYNPEPKNKDGIPTINYITSDVWDRFVHAPNTLILTVKDKRYFIDISSVLLLELNEEFKVKEIAYKTAEGKIWYVDSKEISVYSSDYKFEKEESHDLGITPVVFISNKLLDYRKPLIRINFFIKSLGEIEELLTIGISANIINRHIIPYLVKAKQRNCEYREGDIYCEDGFLWKTIENKEPQQLFNDKSPVKCPHCNTEIGFGSVIEITTNNLSPDEITSLIQNSVAYKNLEIDILEYPNKAKETYEDNLFNKIVNKQERLNNAQQHNEARVLSTYEDRMNVILYWKESFEILLSDLITISLKYKNPKYVTTDVSLGNKFYLNSETEYQELITKAQNTETTDYVDYYRGLIDKQYSGNETEKRRALFILDLQVSGKPYFNIHIKELVQLYKDGLISIEEFKLNQNYMMYVRQMELKQNMSIDNIYLEKDYNERIKLINQKIKDYAKL